MGRWACAHGAVGADFLGEKNGNWRNGNYSGRLVPAKMDRLGDNYGWNDAVCVHKFGAQTVRLSGHKLVAKPELVISATEIPVFSSDFPSDPRPRVAGYAPKRNGNKPWETSIS